MTPTNSSLEAPRNHHNSRNVHVRARHSFKTNQAVDEEVIKSSVFDIFATRERFKYLAKDIAAYFFKFVCCRKKKSSFLKKEHNRNHLYFARGEQKLTKELDVIHLLRSVRRSQLLF